jgi:hypothetical protein
MRRRLGDRIVVHGDLEVARADEARHASEQASAANARVDGFADARRDSFRPSRREVSHVARETLVSGCGSGVRSTRCAASGHQRTARTSPVAREVAPAVAGLRASVPSIYYARRSNR